MTATENTIRFSGHTLDKATKAKVTLENYYSNLIAQHIERKQRCAANLVFNKLKFAGYQCVQSKIGFMHICAVKIRNY